MKFRRSIIVVVWLLCLLCVYAPSVSARRVKALPADAAAGMVGVNTHFNYTDTPYYQHYDEIVKPRLIELGVRHIRDNPSTNPKVRERYAELAGHGIKLLLINWNQPRDFLLARSLNTDYGIKVVEAVEPPNEKDKWRDEMKEHMAAMWAAYKNDSATKDIVILGPSYANTRSSPGNFAAFWPEAKRCMQRGNTHDYCGTYPEGTLGGGWGFALDDALAEQKKLCGDLPIWATENGYKNSKSAPGHPAVTERAAAKYLPRQFLLHLGKGVERFYIYQLINCKPNRQHEDFGIINDDGSPRKQYHAVKNFIRLFSDPGADFETDSLDYELEGNLKDIHHILLQKRDRRFYLVLWQGVESSAYAKTDANIADIEPAPRRLTLKLGAKAQTVKLYTPSFSAGVIESHGAPDGIKSVDLSVPDHILVTELSLAARKRDRP